MRKIVKRLVALTITLCLSVGLVACNKNMLGKTSPNGAVEWQLLGVQNVKTFADQTAMSSSTLVLAYLEAVNKTEREVYISRKGLTANTQVLDWSDDELATKYSQFGTRIASGKRRVFCLCFDLYTEWEELKLTYTSYGTNADMEMRIKGEDHREEKPLLKGDTSYPLDTRDNADILADFEVVSRRERESLWMSSPDDAEVARLLSLAVVGDEGTYFSNVDYADQNVANWGPAKHLSQLQSLLVYCGEERLKTDEQARNTALSLLEYWLSKDYTSKNWWHNQLNNPRTLAAIALMLDPYLSDSQRNWVDGFIGRGSLRDNAAVLREAGANLTDQMAITVSHAVFSNDPDLLYLAMYRLVQEIRIVEYGEEGMQADGSFFQHGTLLHSAHGYGLAFIKSVGNTLVKLHGTCFAFPDEKVRLFVDHILDGERYFHRQNGAAYFSTGRFATTTAETKTLQPAIAALASCEGLYRSEDLRAYAASFDDLNKNMDSIRYFSQAYALINTAPDGYFAVRGAHEGTVLTEAINGQNQRGYNLSYGANTCYLYNGDEYLRIGAVMDYAMFPGTTAYHESDAVLFNRYKESYGKTWGGLAYHGTHCGGAVDEANGLGALYMQLENDGITGKLAFIHYNGGTVVLGADLTCDKENNTTEIRTTVNQCVADGAKVGDVVLSKGKTVTVAEGTAVYNGAFAYYSLDGSLIASVDTKSGTTLRNNGGGDNVVQTEDVFSLYYTHGTALQNGTYAYAVTTGEKPPIQTLTNTETVQAVEFTDGHAVVIFHTAGSHTLSSGEVVSSDTPTVVIH